MDFEVLRPLLEAFFDDDDEVHGVEDYFLLLNWFPEIPEYRGHYRDFIPRINNYVEQIVPLYNPNDFIQTFRLTRTKFEYLRDLLGPELQTQTFHGRPTLSIDKQILFTLYYLGTPNCYRSVCAMFGVGQATGWRAVMRVLQVLYSYRNVFIKWPTREQAMASIRSFEDRYGFPGVIGCGDGTHVEIEPPVAERHYYICRKNFPSIQTQAVCNENLSFIHVFSGFPGSVHDSRVFRHSGVQSKCNELDMYGDNHIIVDSAYTLQRHVMRPYRDNGHLTAEQRHYNRTLSRARATMERAFALLKIRWRKLLGVVPLRRLDLIPYFTVVCCILHNICIMPHADLQHPVLIPAPPPYVGHQNPTAQQRRQGMAKRINITQQLAQNLN